MSYETTGSPSLCVAQSPPSDWKRVFPAAGPKSRLPVVLSKTAKLVLFHWTYCFAPTRPLTSGGLLPGTNPLRVVPIPSKTRPVGLGAERGDPWKVCPVPRALLASVGGFVRGGSHSKRAGARAGG